MAETAGTLFPTTSDRDESRPQHSTGILPDRAIRRLIRNREIRSASDITDRQIQPASIDLRLGECAYRVRASFLPSENATVEEKIAQLGMQEFDLTNGAVLEKGCVYIVRLLEMLDLTSRISGLANPKSSTGRLDVFTRLITDRSAEFDRVKSGYKGALYAEISPRTFSILVRKGTPLNQLRLRRGSPPPSDTALRKLHEQTPLVHSEDGHANISKGIAITVDLQGASGDGLIGYKARKHSDVIDVEKTGNYDPLDFWEPIHARDDHSLILDPDTFHILASKEPVTVPPDHAAEMAAYDPLVGEFRVHYAGFFDPGFGYSESGGAGSRAVLEVRSHEVPFLIEDGQIVGRLTYERLIDIPDRLYGSDIGSSYQRQGRALGKPFKRE